MKRLLLILLVALTCLGPPRPSLAADPLRELVQACVFGATLFGSAALLAGPGTVAAGVAGVAATAVVAPPGLTSAVLGCVLVVGADATTRTVTRLYDYLTTGQSGIRPPYPTPRTAPLLPRLEYRVERDSPA